MSTPGSFLVSANGMNDRKQKKRAPVPSRSDFDQ